VLVSRRRRALPRDLAAAAARVERMWCDEESGVAHGAASIPTLKTRGISARA
jgi:hypothetical protein